MNSVSTSILIHDQKFIEKYSYKPNRLLYGFAFLQTLQISYSQFYQNAESAIHSKSEVKLLAKSEFKPSRDIKPSW